MLIFPARPRLIDIDISYCSHHTTVPNIIIKPSAGFKCMLNAYFPILTYHIWSALILAL